MNASSKSHLRDRLLKVALEECHSILKPLKARCPGLSKIQVAFEDAPSTALLQLGVMSDCDSHYDADKQELVIFLFNVYENGHEADEFRRRVREAVMEAVEDIGGEPDRGVL